MSPSRKNTLRDTLPTGPDIGLPRTSFLSYLLSPTSPPTVVASRIQPVTTAAALTIQALHPSTQSFPATVANSDSSPKTSVSLQTLNERQPLLTPIVEINELVDEDEDEEGQIGFWGEYTPIPRQNQLLNTVCDGVGGWEEFEKRKGWRWAVWDVLGVGVYAVVILLVVLGLDVVLGFGGDSGEACIVR